MAGFNSSAITQPFSISVVTSNGTDQLKTLLAPSWVSTPNVRGTSDILQSCILTLVACIYTALHLDVPKKTTWQYLLWKKFKWVVITLFAPEVAVFVAATQLRYAWNLRSALQKIRKIQQVLSEGAFDVDFEINLKYAFFIVMGAVRFDVHDILSFTDLDKAYRDHFKETGLDLRSVRAAPASIIWLAERGHWIKVRKQDIDDKSKANTFQKALVLIQVLWMVTQCIARRISNLPLSLLEIHTIVHVVCAVFLYICWFEKPLDVQEAIITPTEKFKSDLAIMLQKHFYTDISHKMALFPSKDNEDRLPPIDANGSQMRWIDPRSGAAMSEGDILPSGLALSAAKVKKSPKSSIYYLDPQGEPTGISIKPEPEFLARWDAILATYPSESRERLAQESDRIIMRSIDRHDESQDLTSVRKILYIPTLEELEPLGWVTDHNRLFWEKESILHLHLEDSLETNKEKYSKESHITPDLTLISWQFFLLAIILSGLYGGVHLTIWGQAFPSYVEELLWKVSCLMVISWIPFFFPCFAAGCVLFDIIDKWENKTGRKSILYFFSVLVTTWVWVLFTVVASLVYIVARVFIIVESFLCLRRAPVGVFLSPEWLELFPHF